jgi:tetratricopeptide (TPR) repeat protein
MAQVIRLMLCDVLEVWCYVNPSVDSRLKLNLRQMKKSLVIFLVMFYSFPVLSQDALEFYNQGIEMAYEEKYDEAIKLFTKAIETEPNHPNIHFAWYNRGLAKAFKKNFQEAILDFDSAISKRTDYFLAINMRGVSKKNLNDYTGAIKDYTLILEIDSTYTDALQNRAEAFRLSDQIDKACRDWRRASELGSVNAVRAINQFCLKPGEEKFGVIKRLTNTSESPNYGFSKEYPVKVGSFTGGGPQSQEAYLELLRDGQNKPVKYKRAGSCCHYASKNGMMGMGALDIYEIIYHDEKGKKRTADIYITFYDYEEPKVLYGFKTISK